jgi:hypothetical protein
MTESMPPPAPKPKTFDVFWRDTDRSTTALKNVTSSRMDGDNLFLASHDKEWVINMRETTMVIIMDES